MGIVLNHNFESWEADATYGGYKPASWVKTVPVSEELVTNGDFATEDLTGWTAAAGWSGVSGAAAHNGGIADTTALVQALTLVDDVRYLVRLSVSGRTAGSISVDIGNTDGGPVVIDEDGDFSIELVATAAGAANLSITPTATFDGSVDDISVIGMATDIMENGDADEQASPDCLKSAEFSIDDIPNEAVLTGAITLEASGWYKLSFWHRLLYGSASRAIQARIKVHGQNLWLSEAGTWEATEQNHEFSPGVLADKKVVRFYAHADYTSYDLIFASNDAQGAEDEDGILVPERFVISNVKIDPIAGDDPSLRPENNDTARAALPQNS